MRTVKIGAVAFLVEDCSHTIAQNLVQGCKYIYEAAQQSCDIILLPEMFRTINVPGKELEAEDINGETRKQLAKTAKENNINVVANWYVREDNQIYNQTTIFDRKGTIVGAYRKVQPTAGEAKVVTPGTDFPVFDLDFGRIAIMVCLDIYFPEIARIYAHKGAELLFWPTVTVGPTQDGLRSQLISRAIDNCLHIVESNMAVAPPYAPYAGRYRPGTARIVDFNGEILSTTGRNHGIATAQIDLDQKRLTSYCILKREPDHFRQDLEAITRLDLYAREYATLATEQVRDPDYFSKI